MIHCQCEREVITSIKSSWKLVTRVVPRGQYLVKSCFASSLKILMSSKFTYKIKLGEAVDMPEGHAAIQKEFDVLKKWDNRNLMKFNK